MVKKCISIIEEEPPRPTGDDEVDYRARLAYFCRALGLVTRRDQIKAVARSNIPEGSAPIKIYTQILDLLIEKNAKDEGVTLGEIQKKCGIAERTARKYMRRLREVGLVDVVSHKPLLVKLRRKTFKSSVEAVMRDIEKVFEDYLLETAKGIDSVSYV